MYIKLPIIALGELLIDFTPSGLSNDGRPLYEQNPGGAPANVLAAAAKMGCCGGLISCVGDDFFGECLISELNGLHIDTNGVQKTNTATTTLAFVKLDETGDRSFAFARKPGADMLLDAVKIDYESVQNCKIFHFGSISLSAKASKEATFAAIKAAKIGGALISYDPNWRPMLWTDENVGIAAMKEGLQYADIVKLSEDELTLISGCNGLNEGAKAVQDQWKNLRLVVVTRGAKGCYYRLSDTDGTLNTYTVKVLDTTGAGDAFWGVFLSGLYNDMSALSGDIDKLRDMLKKANAAGALCASKRGAISAMPSKDDVMKMVQMGANAGR